MEPALDAPVVTPHPAVLEQRARYRDELTRGRLDVLVIGGGALGLATAWQAARSGARVGLLERGDIAGATSSASSKLVHGGLRYLARGDVALVRENHVERRLLAGVLAPHLVRPLPFLVPIYRGAPHGPLSMGAGVMLYSALSRFGDGVGRLVKRRTALDMVPGMRTANLRGVALYHDHQMNDARLAVALARGASDAGAVLLTRCAVVGIDGHERGPLTVEARDALAGAALVVTATRVVNATGPWVDAVRRLENPAAGTSVRLSKGVHAVVRGGSTWRAALTVPQDGGRVAFAIPWEGNLLLGTTDEEFDGDPATVGVTDDDLAYVLREARAAVVDPVPGMDDVIARFAGLRVLPAGDGTVASASRETVVTRGRLGMVSVAGGKWTTVRRIGAQVARSLDLPGLVPAPVSPLPGAAPLAAVTRALRARRPDLPADVAAHLAHCLGTLAHAALALADDDSALLERIHPDGPDIWAQAAYARSAEWAVDVDDVLRRRTTVTVRGLANDEVRARTAALLSLWPDPAWRTEGRVASGPVALNDAAAAAV